MSYNFDGPEDLYHGPRKYTGSPMPRNSRRPLEQGAGDLMHAVLLQAIEDYVSLREIGCISGTSVERKMWNYTINTAWRFKPLGYSTAQMVEELVEFLAGPHLELVCDYLDIPACRLRVRLGITNSDGRAGRLLTTDEMYWISTPSKTRRKMLTSRNGEGLPDIPLYNTTESVVPDDDAELAKEVA